MKWNQIYWSLLVIGILGWLTVLVINIKPVKYCDTKKAQAMDMFEKVQYLKTCTARGTNGRTKNTAKKGNR